MIINQNRLEAQRLVCLFVPTHTHTHNWSTQHNLLGLVYLMSICVSDWDYGGKVISFQRRLNFQDLLTRPRQDSAGMFRPSATPCLIGCRLASSPLAFPPGTPGPVHPGVISAFRSLPLLNLFLQPSEVSF